MKRHIGNFIAAIGARLWEKNGFWTAESYEDLKVTGKVGYNLFCTGMKMMGYKLPEDVENAVNR